ncbi:SAM-dependent methyltransferase [Elioraea rosea]|uniref:SAM-dependent methyltransferase n=1 Tax=Elioraea rosea TaxID=2492390 RepID=UPI0013157FD3|nr:SAM-dependent methyltransferase [Elioraea rosea]
MPTSGVRAHLAALYAGSDDPWNTHGSAYEREKFSQTMASLPRSRYRRCLEVGCGAGALTALLAARCDGLVAIDCTAEAVAAAKAHASRANVAFIEGTVPWVWPAQAPDLVILSEVLYFMTDDESAALAVRLAEDCADHCDVVLVNWRGDTGGAINGEAAALRLTRRLAETHRLLASCGFGRFHIDVLRRIRCRESSGAEREELEGRDSGTDHRG